MTGSTLSAIAVRILSTEPLCYDQRSKFCTR